VLVVEPGESGSVKIEQVRDVVDRAAYRPFEGRRRVVIVDRADALVPAAQNALLKTLEEPPPSSIFILVSSRPDMLLPTVRSRCPMLRFRPIAAREIAGYLVARGQAEPQARAMASAAQGSLGRAVAGGAGDPDALIASRDIAHRVLVRAAETPDPRRRIEMAKDLLAGTGAGGAADRERLGSHLDAMASLLRDTELLSASGDAEGLTHPEARTAIDRLLPAYRGGRARRAFASVNRARAALEQNASVKIVADWLVLQL
jgi:DNA polymerase-3 subunit delta'